MCGTNMQSLFYLIKDRCTLNKYIVFSKALGMNVYIYRYMCVQIITVYISVFNVKKKHDVGPYIVLQDIKWFSSEEYSASTNIMKAFFNRRGTYSNKEECWMHTNNLPMGVIMVGSI